MNGAPLVSVIVPTFRRVDYLKLTLRSILSQTYPHFELLVVSDGHDDATETVVSSLADDRTQYLTVPHAGFPAAPRNEGLRQAQGELLALCDDDDLWHRDKLQLQVDTLHSQSVSCCMTEYDYIDQRGEPLDRHNHYEAYHGRVTWKAFYRSMGFICNSSVVFTRAAFEVTGFVNESSRLRAHEDFEYWARMLQHGDGYFIDTPLVSYRVHLGSIQRASAWKVYRDRRHLHRVMHSNHAVPWRDRLFKQSKLATHFLWDQFPRLRRVCRRLQGRGEFD